VLEFDEFLKMKGCSEGKHVFVPKVQPGGSVRPTLRKLFCPELIIQLYRRMSLLRHGSTTTRHRLRCMSLYSPRNRTKNAAPSRSRRALYVYVLIRRSDSLTVVDQLLLDLYLPNSKRFKKSIELFGPVDAAASTHKFFGTKVGSVQLIVYHILITEQVEVVLRKKDTRSWTILEKPLRDLGPVALTFGVSGRTGTIGAKDLILDADNAIGRG
jgi:hypothetical protein